MTQTIKIRNEPAQHIGVANSAPCPEMNIIAKEITENGRYEARAEGVTGFDPVIVNVPSREEIGYENGYAAGYGKGSTDGYADALAKRTELEVTANGEYIPEGESTGFSKVSVNLPSDTAVIDGLIDGTISGAYRNDRVTNVRKYAFRENVNLTGIDLPNATEIGNYAIYSCSQLTYLNLPSAQSLGTSAVFSCGKLQTVLIPSATHIASACFSRCCELDYVELPLATNIDSQAFQSCQSLTTFILRSPDVCKLNNANVFEGTPIKSGTGFIFVPDNLLEDYRKATNWATYASQIKPISELEE
jgi:hypothetical protein